MPIFNSTSLGRDSLLLQNYIREHEDIETCIYRITERQTENGSLLLIKNNTTRKGLHISFTRNKPGCKVLFVTSNPNTPEFINNQQQINKEIILVMKADLFSPAMLEELLTFLYKSKHYPTSEKLEAVSNRNELNDSNVYAKRVTLISTGGNYSTIYFEDDTCVQKLNTELKEFIEVMKPGCMYIENNQGVFSIKRYNHFARSFIFKDSDEYQINLCKRP